MSSPDESPAGEAPPPEAPKPERMPQFRPPPLGDRILAAPVTSVLFVINAIVFVIAEHHGNTLGLGTLLHFGASERALVRDGDVWRLFTPMFLHIGWVHFLWNGWAMFGWCSTLEPAIGRARFLAIYLAAGVAGAAASVLAHDVVSAGASGAGFGIIGATLAVRRRNLPSWDAFARDANVRRTLGMIALWTALGLSAVRMDSFAHGGGLVAGAALAFALTAERRVLPTAVVALALVTACVLAVAPGARPSATEARNTTLLGKELVAGASINRDVPIGVRLLDIGCRGGDARGCRFAALARSSDDPTQALRQPWLQLDEGEGE